LDELYHDISNANKCVWGTSVLISSSMFELPIEKSNVNTIFTCSTMQILRISMVFSKDDNCTDYGHWWVATAIHVGEIFCISSQNLAVFPTQPFFFLPRWCDHRTTLSFQNIPKTGTSPFQCNLQYLIKSMLFLALSALHNVISHD